LRGFVGEIEVNVLAKKVRFATKKTPWEAPSFVLQVCSKQNS
jgi:hypothetical protein